MRSRMRFLKIAALLCAAGLIVGALASFLRARNDGIALVPSVVELAREPFDGETVQVHLMLENRTGRTISVQRASSSCGCSRLVTRGNRPLTSPIDLQPGEAMPWCATVDTTGSMGALDVGVAVECSVGQRVLNAVSSIRMNVRPGWLAQPRSLFVSNVKPGVEIQREVMICDSYSDPGVELKEVVCSSPDRMNVTVEPMDGLSHIARSEGDIPVKNRYRLRLSYVAQKIGKVSQAWITLIPKDASRGKLHISVVCLMQEPSHVLFPPRLVFLGVPPGKKVIRTVQCRTKTAAQSKLRVLDCPNYAKVSITSLDANTSLIKVECIVPDRERAEDRIAFAVGSDNREVVSLPLISHVLPTDGPTLSD